MSRDCECGKPVEHPGDHPGECCDCFDNRIFGMFEDESQWIPVNRDG